MALVARTRAMGYRVALAIMRVWWVVRRPRSAGVRCVLRHGHEIVLVRHSYGDPRWMLPGGRVRRGESPQVTARREMAQELGVACEDWTLLGCCAARRGYRRRSAGDGFRRHTTYYLEAEVPRTRLQPRRGELSDASWFSTATLPEDRCESLDAAAHAGWLAVMTLP